MTLAGRRLWRAVERLRAARQQRQRSDSEQAELDEQQAKRELLYAIELLEQADPSSRRILE